MIGQKLFWIVAYGASDETKVQPNGKLEITLCKLWKLEIRQIGLFVLETNGDVCTTRMIFFQ